MSTFVWTERTISIMESLTSKVRFLSTQQIATTWWAGTLAAVRTAERHLARLEQAGFLERRTIVAYPVLPLRSPIFSWKPQEPQPDFDVLAYQCAVRWKGSLAAIPVWIASRKAGDHFGGFGGKILKCNQYTHDLHVGELYARMQRERPQLAKGWIPEERIRHLSGRIPDATVVDTEAKTLFGLDFGGFGSVERLARLHTAFTSLQIPYSVW